MKNLLKSLGLAAVVGTLGLNVMNVSAADDLTCPAGETVHTNYYLFLDVNSAEYYDQEIGNATTADPLTAWTSAYKYNNIGVNNNYMNVQMGVTSGSDTSNPDATENWTVEEYWQKFYKAWTGMDSKTLMYDENATTHYLMHNEWWKYDGPSWSNGQLHTEHSDLTGLLDYIRDNYNKLSTSELVRNGTSLPTSKITIPTNMGKEAAGGKSFEWRIARVFGTKDIKTGAINGSVYSPAVHAVKYCSKGTPTQPDQPTADKTIAYRPNTTDTVTNMPKDQTFKDKTTIASANNSPVRPGYEFLGWSTNSKATEADPTYAPGKEYSGNSITLYAVWKPAYKGTYKIDYNANGGKNAPATQTGNTDGACLTISSEKPTHSNPKVKFLGWSRRPDATEPDKAYAAGVEYCGGEGDIVLYAVWQLQTGIGSQIAVFLGIAGLSVAALVIAKKKNLFKQI